MYKRSIFCLLLCILCFCVPVMAEDISFDTPITMTVNHTLIKMDTRPFLHKGTTFVPIRFVSESLGADSVEWDSKRDQAVIVHEGTTIVLPKGQKIGYVNGKPVEVPSGIVLAQDRLFVPIRFVSETLECQVEWIFETYTVNIQKEGIKVPQSLVGKRSYTDDDIYWLSKIIHAESRGEPMEGKIAVGNVILNRVASRDYPNTIYGVIFDRNHGVQFSPVLDGSIYLTPLGDSVIAAKRALEGEKVVGECLFFFNPVTAQSQWIANNRTYYTTIRNHEFYL